MAAAGNAGVADHMIGQLTRNVTAAGKAGVITLAATLMTRRQAKPLGEGSEVWQTSKAEDFTRNQVLPTVGLSFGIHYSSLKQEMEL